MLILAGMSCLAIFMISIVVKVRIPLDVRKGIKPMRIGEVESPEVETFGVLIWGGVRPSRKMESPDEREPSGENV